MFKLQQLLNKRSNMLLFKLILHGACLGPAVWWFWLGAQDQLGADPVKALIHFYGIGAVHCLMATLMVSLLARWLKAPALLRCRRILGLYSFFYASAHILIFMAFDWQWQWSAIGAEVIKRPYMTLGFLAWLIALALALTSFKHLQRVMGKRWAQLHALIYPLLCLALVHFYWSQKSPWDPALVYLLIGIILLGLKRKKLWLWFELWRQNPDNRRESSS